MLFTDSLFLFYFLPAVLIAHRIAISLGARSGEYSGAARLLIFAATVVFYGGHEMWWLLPFFVCIGFDFLWGSLIARSTSERSRHFFLIMSIVQNLTLLGVFKYWNLIVSGLLYAFPALSPEIGPSTLSLPAGISFYTFESLSFVIDLYRRDINLPKRPSEFFAFIAMFPRFIAGPIVRYKELRAQIVDYRGMDLENGLFIFIIGLFSKTCFGDSYAVFVSYAFSGAGDLGFIAAWTGVIAYTMQIYFDFAGYSLMAIGLGRCLGFRFPTNFNKPYQSISLQEFWRRWHMTLSTWLRDYVYISLGGSRGGVLKTYRNLFLTMAIGGIWHGAGLNFLVWGAWHGAFLCIERALQLEKRFSRLGHRVFTLWLVVTGWVFFRAADFAQAIRVLSAMFNPFKLTVSFNPEAFGVNPIASVLCIVGFVYIFVFEPSFDVITLENTTVVSRRKHVAATAMLAGTLVLIFSSFSIPFLYFQF